MAESKAANARRCRLIDRGSEYCGNPERHEYELYLAIEDIDHSRTKSPQTNGRCERFHKTVLDEFYRIAFRKKLYRTIAELQADLDEWLRQLIVTSGLGWTQVEGGSIEELRPGDIVWCPPGVKHWHGAAPATAMTHIAIQEAKDGVDGEGHRRAIPG